ncbi:MAG: hypothetical protein HZC29_07105 [Thaumarchaeota archaeon]|nr:hypothetical protein [Nitrososphaerota archaeon]
MVFGWGKKKTEDAQNLPQKDSTRNRLKVEEISSVLDSLKEKKRQKITTQVKPLFSEMQSELNEIYKIIDHLKNDNLKVDDIDKTLKVLVVRSKTEVIDVITKESKNSLPTVVTFSDAIKTADAASHTLKKIGDVLGKNSRVIHVFAKKYAEDLKSHLGLVTKNNILVTKMLSDFSSLESSSDTIKDTVSKVHTATQEIRDMASHITKLENSELEFTKLHDSTQKQISELSSSAEYGRFLELHNKIKQIKSEEEKLNKEIDDEFSKVSRPLGKYVYVTSLEKPLKAILERLVERPSQVLATESKDAIVTILESCMKGILSGTVSVKETDKSVDYITNLVSILDGLMSKKNSFKSQIDEIERNTTVFDSGKLGSLEKQLAKAKSDREDAQIKIKNLKSDLEQKTAQKQKLLQDLESSLERLDGTKYEIIVE